MAKDLDGPTLSEFFAEISRNVSAAFDQHPQMWTSDPSISNIPIEGFFYPEGTGYALLIGINHYGRVSNLHGCVNDANDWKDQLVSCGWKARNIRLMLNRQATKAKVLQNMKWLVSHRGPKDSLLFHFSGHGNWTLTPEGWQCCICCSDYEQVGETAVGAITNTEYWNELEKKAPETLLLCFNDSCFSGGMAPNTRPRKQLPAKVRQLLSSFGGERFRTSIKSASRRKG